MLILSKFKSTVFKMTEQIYTNFKQDYYINDESFIFVTFRN